MALIQRNGEKDGVLANTLQKKWKKVDQSDKFKLIDFRLNISEVTFTIWSHHACWLENCLIDSISRFARQCSHKSKLVIDKLKYPMSGFFWFKCHACIYLLECNGPWLFSWTCQLFKVKLFIDGTDPIFTIDHYIDIEMLRSDHARFWTINNRRYFASLPAVVLHDTGASRGGMELCYHGPCDIYNHRGGHQQVLVYYALGKD